MGKRQKIGGVKEAHNILQYFVKDVEEKTIKRRIETAANPMENR
jgi:hypothetical protein